MKVKNLIKKLKQYDGDSYVYDLYDGMILEPDNLPNWITTDEEYDDGILITPNKQKTRN